MNSIIFQIDIAKISKKKTEIGKNMNYLLFSLVRFEKSSEKIIENLQIILLERLKKSPKK